MEHILVEVRAQNEGERNERDSGERPLTGHVAQGSEERDVDEQVDLRVEVAPERARPSRPPRELTVGVVQHGLHLEEHRRGDELASNDEIHGAEACDSVRELDDPRRYAQGQQDAHERPRERAEDRRREELRVRPPAERVAGRRLDLRRAVPLA